MLPTCMAVARVFPIARVNVVGGWLCRPARGRQQARLDAIQLKWRSAADDRCWRHLAATADDSNTSRQRHRRSRRLVLVTINHAASTPPQSTLYY